MTPERWGQIEKVYHGALECPAGERAVYLAQACGGDGELRREVESLLQQDDKTGDLLKVPAMEIAARAMAGENTMSLAGKQLGSYQVVSRIGAGGMGEVYRARDTKLGREVAIKVLPPEFVRDAERLSRFRREAKLLASLNHPNIATIYGLEDSGEIHFLVMELVEGQTLAARVASGPIPVTDALKIGQQIAEALEHAHQHKVIHRDLKPANVILMRTGRVKVLDFGLAKALADESVASSDAVTVSLLPTEVGRVMGTPAYMSPEQAQGKPVDKQTDIWAFGCVLYELLTGQRAFLGENVSQILASVLRSEPDWRKLPSDTPQTIRALLRRCLQKEQNRRFHSAADLGIAIEESLSSPADVLAAPTAVPGQSHPKGRERLAWSLAAILGIVAVAALVNVQHRSSDGSELPIRVSVPIPEGLALENSFPPAISPDGRRLAFQAFDSSGKHQLWIRSLDTGQAQPLEGTEGAEGQFWAPDSQRLGFFADRKLKKLDIATGSVQIITDAPTGRGGAWNRDDLILFAPNTGSILYTVSASGGQTTPVTSLDTTLNETGGHRYPQFHPDGRHFVYFSVDKGFFAGSLASKQTKRLLPLNSRASFAPDGRLLYVNGETLVAQDFDAERLELTGEPHPVAKGVARYEPHGDAAFSISENGVLAYQTPGFRDKQLAWLDRNGARIGAVGEPEDYGGDINISPDGKRAVVVRLDPQTGIYNIWLIDLLRDISSRLLSGPTSTPVWSPDGRQIAFGSLKNGKSDIVLKTLESGAEEVLLETKEDNSFAYDWSRDGQSLLYGTLAQGKTALWTLPMLGDRKPRQLAHNEFWTDRLQMSPDGRWISYISDDSGRLELYIQPFQRPGEKVRVSTAGSGQMRWRGDSRELFYLAGDGTMMSVAIDAGSELKTGRPKSLFPTGVAVSTTTNQFAVTADGQRFLVLLPAPRKDSSLITVVLNWTAALKE